MHDLRYEEWKTALERYETVEMMTHLYFSEREMLRFMADHSTTYVSAKPEHLHRHIQTLEKLARKILYTIEQLKKETNQ